MHSGKFEARVTVDVSTSARGRRSDDLGTRGDYGDRGASGATGFTSFQNYPEYTNFQQFNPDGALGSDMRHRANLWLQYNLPTSRLGTFNFSLLQRYHSALSYSAVGTIDASSTRATPRRRPT
jgi:hypothetical protein